MGRFWGRRGGKRYISLAKKIAAIYYFACNSMTPKHDSKLLIYSSASAAVGMPHLQPVSKEAIILILSAPAVFLIIIGFVPTKRVWADKPALQEINLLSWKNSIHKQQSMLAGKPPFSLPEAIANANKKTLKVPFEPFTATEPSFPKESSRQVTSDHSYTTSVQKSWMPSLFSAKRLALPKLGETARQQEESQERHAPEVKQDTWRGRPLRELPVIIEPMMFDLIRPLHAQKGEWEFNTLGFFPLHPETEFSWEPEFEYAIGDGFAVELELPFVNEELEFLKFTTQYTLGTGLNNKLIHAVQGIYEYGLDGGVSVPTGLWIVGVRLSRTWSFIGMSGLRSFISPQEGIQHTELLKNVALYADISETWNVGVEANIEQDFSGPTNAVLMPQAHWHLTDLIELRFGVGVEISPDRTVPLGAFRVVYSPH
jgi:hypothetical protein